MDRYISIRVVTYCSFRSDSYTLSFLSFRMFMIVCFDSDDFVIFNPLKTRAYKRNSDKNALAIASSKNSIDTTTY